MLTRESTSQNARLTWVRARYRATSDHELTFVRHVGRQSPLKSRLANSSGRSTGISRYCVTEVDVPQVSDST